jgi:hypothetical protein
LTRRLGELTWEEGTLTFRPTTPTYTLPPDVAPAGAAFGDVARLRGYDVAQTETSLTLTLYWQALAAGKADYVRFVHLVAAGEEAQILAQVDSMPHNSSYPTSQWTVGEIVADQVLLDLQSVPAGAYRLAVGFYPPQTPLTPLPAQNNRGEHLPDGRFLLPPLVTVK